MSAAQYRKAITVFVLAAVEIAAYVIANPSDLPPWVLAVAGLVNTAAVYWVRNDPPARHGPTTKTKEELAGPQA